LKGKKNIGDKSEGQSHNLADETERAGEKTE